MPRAPKPCPQTQHKPGIRQWLMASSALAKKAARLQQDWQAGTTSYANCKCLVELNKDVLAGWDTGTVAMV